MKSKSNNLPSASKLRILSFNPNSIGKNPKRANVIQAIRKKQANIILFSDTRISTDVEPSIRAEWGGKINFASYTSQARGVAVFFTKELAIEIIENTIYNDKSGNFTVMNVKYENSVITIACIYGPNSDEPDFYEKIVFKEIEKCQQSSDYTLMGGDWNISLSQELDTFGYTAENNLNAKNYLLSCMENLGLVDIFRYLHPNVKRYSWRQFGGNKRARLDFFLISATLLPFVEKADILAGVNSDHSMPVLDIDFARFQRGRGFFKFNNSLINDPEYIKVVIDAIKNVTKQYAEDIYDIAFLESATPEQLQSVILTIDPQLFLECLLLEIRGKTISYCAWQKKVKNGAHNLALHRLEMAELTSDQDPSNADLKRQLEVAREEVEDFNKNKAEGAMCRARINWQVHGEKPNRYFCNLEKYNALQKYIPQLLVQNSTGKVEIVSDQKDVDGEIFKFYKNLYRSQESQLKYLTIEGFLSPNKHIHSKLSEAQSEKLEGLITVDEATRYMKQCRSDASPGSSGFTGGFYKLFWRNLKHFIVNSLNFAYETGNLSVSQKLGIIILLPKPEKDKRLLANWRPISLLNHIYKILSGALAERLKPALEHIIHTDQKGFVAGRFIGECVRNTYDVLEYAKSKNRAGLLLLIDFEKAFDSISHSFIIKCLHFFGFGLSFIKWINVILNDVSSCVNHCGNISERFKVGRSCRQGDPISPYLFIICVEILAIKIRENKGVKGFKMGNFEQKLDFYADDLTAYLDGSKESLFNIVGILNEFKELSGLKINLTKCKAIWIGSSRFSERKLCESLNLIWTNKFRLLGIDFDSDLACMDTNFRNKIEEIDKLYKCWLYRNLTPFGKITIIKSLALSKLSHVAMVCPLVDKSLLTKLKNMTFNFLWNGKPDRMKRTESGLPSEKGGLNMPDIEAFWASLKMTWARRLLATNCLWQKILNLNLLYVDHDMGDLWYGGPTLLRKIANKLSNLFWKEVIETFALLTEDLHFSRPYFFYNFNIFDNPLFSKNGVELNSEDFSSLRNKQLCQVGDYFNCLKSPPELLPLQQLNIKYGVNLNFLNYHRIRKAIINAATWLNHKIYEEQFSDTKLPRLPLIHKLSCLSSKGCRPFYVALKSREWSGISTSESENKWLAELGAHFSLEFWEKIWFLNKQSIVSNKTKWVNLQICRFILPTNYSVNKYKPSQDPGCSFCIHHLERLPFLIWGCPVVREFWDMVGNILKFYYPNFTLGRKEAIFGDIKSKGDSVINTMLLLAKQFIWKEKFCSKNIDEVKYISFMRKELNYLLENMDFKGNGIKFRNEWINILEHFNVD